VGSACQSADAWDGGSAFQSADACGVWEARVSSTVLSADVRDVGNATKKGLALSEVVSNHVNYIYVLKVACSWPGPSLQHVPLLLHPNA